MNYKIKIILLSIVATNSAFASDEDFNIELGSTPITTITIKQDNLKELRNYYKLSNDGEFAFMSNDRVRFLGHIDFIINDGRKAIQYNLIPSEDKNPSESSIIDEFNLRLNSSLEPTNISNNPKNNFKISAQYFVDYFYIQNIHYEYVHREWSNLRTRVEKYHLVIKYSDDSFSIIPMRKILHTSFTKDDTYFRHIPEFKKYFENEKELDMGYFN